MPEISQEELDALKASQAQAATLAAEKAALETTQTEQAAQLAELAKFKADAEAANMSAAEKAQAELAAANAKAAQAEQAAAEAQANARVTLIRAEATALGFHSPDDAPALAGDKIKPDASNIKEALKALATEKPYLLKGDGGPGPAGGGQFNPKSNTQQTDQAKAAAHKAGFAGVMGRLVFPGAGK